MTEPGGEGKAFSKGNAEVNAWVDRLVDQAEKSKSSLMLEQAQAKKEENKKEREQEIASLAASIEEAKAELVRCDEQIRYLEESLQKNGEDPLSVLVTEARKRALEQFQEKRERLRTFIVQQDVDLALLKRQYEVVFGSSFLP